jgi:hypothetical protein
MRLRTFQVPYGRAREKRLAVDYLTNFSLMLALDLMVLVIRPRDPSYEAFWFRDANGILTQMRQVPVGSRYKGIKVKGDEPLTWADYCCWVLGSLNLEVESNLWDINAGAIGEIGPDRVPKGLMWGITRIIGSFMRECISLIMQTPAPARIDIRPLVEGYRAEYRWLVRRRERKMLKRSATVVSGTPYMIW